PRAQCPERTVIRGHRAAVEADGSTEEAGAGIGHSETTRTGASLSGHELMVRAFRNVVPRAHQRLELREGRVDLPSHPRLLGFFPENRGRQFPQIAEHWQWELHDLDLAFELSLESL